MIIIKVFLGVN